MLIIIGFLYSINCDNSVDPKNLDLLWNLKNCEDISLHFCYAQDMERMTELYINDCDTVKDVSPIENIKTIELIYFDNLQMFSDLSFVENLPKLRVFTLQNCPSINNLDRMNSNSLYSLVLNNMSGLKALGFNSYDLVNLHSLHINNSDSLINLNSIGNLPLLKNLRLYNCKNIQNIDELCFAKALIEISFHTLNINKIQSISQLSNLQTLILYNCVNVEDINFVTSLFSLTKFQLNGNNIISELSPLVNLQNLKVVDIRLCNKIIDYTPLLNCLGKDDTLITDVNISDTLKRRFEIKGVVFK